MDFCVASNGTGVANNSGTTRLSNNDIAFNTTGISGATTSLGLNRISANGSAGTGPTAACANFTGLFPVVGHVRRGLASNLSLGSERLSPLASVVRRTTVSSTRLQQIARSLWPGIEQ